jgi:hypothetical protein
MLFHMLTRTLHRRRILLGALVFMFGFTVGRYVLHRLWARCRARCDRLEYELWSEFNLESFRPSERAVRALKDVLREHYQAPVGAVVQVRNPYDQKRAYENSKNLQSRFLLQQTPQSMLVETVLADPRMPRNCPVCDFPLKTEVVQGALRSPGNYHEWWITSMCWGPTRHDWKTKVNISQMMLHESNPMGIRHAAGALLRAAVTRHVTELQMARTQRPIRPLPHLTPSAEEIKLTD